ncbi:MAG: hypothetical protein Q4C49_07145 [Bacillota bacterium]|nr:hypothetical protein [Bacillota bacterium]
MEEKFTQFLDDIPTNFQSFVLDLDHYLLENGCKRTIKERKVVL